MCGIAQQQVSAVVVAAGFCSALPDDEESEECWKAYQYYEDKRVRTSKYQPCLHTEAKRSQQGVSLILLYSQLCNHAAA